MHFQQRTVAQPVVCSGIGVHSGKKVRLTIKPAPVNHGIRFIRTDLPDSPGISAHLNMVVDTSLATVIGYNGFIVSTIEHLMACFAGLSIDNAFVELDAYEMPIMDGSAGPFAKLIRSAGIVKQAESRCVFIVKKPIMLKEDGKAVCVYPSPEFKVTYSIAYPHPLIKEQTYSLTIAEDTFEKEISWARTFGFIQEIEYLKHYGFAKGGSLDNAIVLDQNGILNTDGLRYPDEFVRHKILDCLGDFSLLGLPIMGHIVVEKSGHAFNHQFLKKFFNQRESWETRFLHGTSLDMTHPPARRAKSLAI